MATQKSKTGKEHPALAAVAATLAEMGITEA